MSETTGITKITNMIQRAMRDQDRFAVRIVYRDHAGRRTRRIVSPSRWGQNGRYTFLALCTARQESRWFTTASVESAELVSTSVVLMPTDVEEL